MNGLVRLHKEIHRYGVWTAFQLRWGYRKLYASHGRDVGVKSAAYLHDEAKIWRRAGQPEAAAMFEEFARSPREGVRGGRDR